MEKIGLSSSVGQVGPHNLWSKGRSIVICGAEKGLASSVEQMYVSCRCRVQVGQ